MLVKWVVFGYPMGKPVKKQYVAFKGNKMVLVDFKKAHSWGTFEAAQFALDKLREEKTPGMIYNMGTLTA